MVSVMSSNAGRRYGRADEYTAIAKVELVNVNFSCAVSIQFLVYAVSKA